MNTRIFNKVVERRIDLIRKILLNKAKEYSSDTDRLHNFKVAAQLSSIPITPEQALFGMLRKHLTSVIDIVESSTMPLKTLRDEKIGDSINYLILLEALLDERDTVEIITEEGTNAIFTRESIKEDF